VAVPVGRQTATNVWSSCQNVALGVKSSIFDWLVVGMECGGGICLTVC